MTKYLIISGLAVISLAACNPSTASNTSQPAVEEALPAESDHTAVDHSGHDMPKMTADMGHGEGTIISIGELNDSLTIDHGPIDGIGMGAMTMGFDIVSGVDLSGFSTGEKVAFMVKKGRDNSYRITALCSMDQKGADCMGAMMER